jgi:uncharacterized protein YfiM (DUF2279 family)
LLLLCVSTKGHCGALKNHFFYAKALNGSGGEREASEEQEEQRKTKFLITFSLSLTPTVLADISRGNFLPLNSLARLAKWILCVL